MTPNQIRGAYGLGTYGSGGITGGIMFGSVQGDGSGQTIAIVDAFDYTSAASDLNAFSSYYGLPQFNVSGGPTFKKLNEAGGTSLPGTDPAGANNNDWEIEEALDIEWAHVIAPNANIILFEATSASNSDLNTAVHTAAGTAGVVAVSMSWSGPEYSGETSDDTAYFTTPSGHAGVTFLAASGDNGAYDATSTTTITPQYPAASPNVVAVGGTTLNVSGNSWASETAWGNGASSGSAGGGGGGISAYESQPSFQSSLTGVSSFSATKRVYPDVSADANPNTGVSVYDTYDFGSAAPWSQFGGTSLATPIWAGIIAIADQGRSLAGLSSLDGPSQTLPMLYHMSAGNFHDITSGSIGPSPTYAATTGYDLTSGRGSPLANLIIPQLVGADTLAFGQPPTSAPAGTAFSPSITVLVNNSGGSPDTSYNGNVTLSLGNNPTGATLLGTATVQAVNGVATFSGLSIDLSGTGYTVVASAGSMPNITSAAFNISSNAAQPTIAAPASASPNPVTGTSTSLSVQGSDPNSQSLTYSWSALSVPSGAAAPGFSSNNSTAAYNTTATFTAAGAYTLLVVFTDSSGNSNDSRVTVTVVPTFTSLSIAPGTSTVSVRSQTQFTAVGIDQFGNSIGVTSSVVWSAAHGTIMSSGLYNPPATGASDTITASSGGSQATAAVTIVAPAGWWKFNEGSGTTAHDSGAGTPDNVTVPGGSWIAAANGTDGTPAMSFDGTGSSIINLGKPSKLNITGQITLSAWVNLSYVDSLTTEYIIDHRTSTSNDIYLGIDNGQYEVGVQLGPAYPGDFYGADFAVPAGDVGAWVHITGTYDGAAWRLYRNGQLVATSVTSQGAISPNGNWGIGSAASGNPYNDPYYYFSGGIDDVRIYNTAISGNAVAGLMGTPPVITTAAAPVANPVTGTAVLLSVSASDDAGASTLTYTWATTGTPPAPVNISVNGTNAAQKTVVAFTKAGVYNFAVTVTNPAGLTATSSVTVTVSATPTTIAVHGGTPAADGTTAFTATASDQFGNALASQPSFTWSLSDGGAISSGGVFTPPYAAGNETITASGDGISGSATATLPGRATWNSAGNTSWNAAGTWTIGSPAVAVAAPGTRTVPGDNAVFANGAGGTVTLDGASPSLAGLTFGDSGSYTISQGSGGALRLANGGGNAVLTVAAGAQTISAPLAFDGNVTISVAAGSTLTVTGDVTGNGHSLTVTGGGTVFFNGLGGNTIGSTTVASGELVIKGPSALAAGSSLTVGDAAAFAAAAAPALSLTPAVSSVAVAAPAFSVWKPEAQASGPTSNARQRSPLVVPPSGGFAQNSASRSNAALPSLFSAATFIGPPLPMRLQPALRSAAAVLAYQNAAASNRDIPAGIQAVDAVFAKYAHIDWHS